MFSQQKPDAVDGNQNKVRMLGASDVKSDLVSALKHFLENQDLSQRTFTTQILKTFKLDGTTYSKEDQVTSLLKYSSQLGLVHDKRQHESGILD